MLKLRTARVIESPCELRELLGFEIDNEGMHQVKF